MSGKQYWRSLGDFAQTPEFRAWAENEFPALASELDESYREGGHSRRRFLTLMGASMALAGLGLGGCRRREAKVLAYGNKPAELIPGKAVFYATTMVLAGVPMGLLVETHEGRPTKIEGNPLHPNSLGASSTFAQASILDLYDPDRSRGSLGKGEPATRERVWGLLEQIREKHLKDGGRGLAILSEDFASPAMEMLKAHLLGAMPQARWYVDEPLASGAVGYDLSKADVIVSLDCDFLGIEDEGVRHKRAFAAGRKIERPGDRMNRLYVAEPAWTVTGAAADHRRRMRAGEVGKLAGQLLEAVEGKKVEDAWVAACARDLARGKGIVLAGGRQPAWVHEVVGEIHRRLNVEHRRPAVGDRGEIRELMARAGEVKTVVILGGNPAYSMGGFGDLVGRAELSVHVSTHANETSAACTWHVGMAHYLESWGDAICSQGVVSAIQPMIEPLFGGVSPLEVVARLGGFEKTDAMAIVKESFGRMAGRGEEPWRKFLQEGVWEGGTKSSLGQQSPTRGLPQRSGKESAPAEGIEVCFAGSQSVWDGRFANNGWLQECPDPMTKLTWDNAAIVSPKTAKQWGAETGDVLRIEVEGKALEIAAFVMPGVAEGSITVALGYGRSRAGAIGDGVGVDVGAIRPVGGGFVAGAKVSNTGRKVRLATTQEHWTIAEHHVVADALKERGIVREGSREEFEKDPGFVGHLGVHAPTALNIYERPKFTGAQQWGMVIDLSACIGCTACTVACQAENNIPIVGKDEVLNGREMHWMRMDRYFTGDDPEGEVGVAAQPMSCQQCENAPCEPVCPVNATVHSPEGLNEMVYNRCIGTRYCSNNCPYKARRFNFFDFNKGTIREKATRDGKTTPLPLAGFTRPQALQGAMDELSRMQKNPQVTVRMRGVMEKCTYCVQRIEQAKIDARVALGQGDAHGAVKVAEGAIRTACEQACPTQAIVFGDVSDPKSRVSKLKKSERNYEVLGHVNTRPRTTYLARIRNPNPEIHESQA